MRLSIVLSTSLGLSDGVDEGSGAAGKFGPIGFLEDFGGDQRGTDAESGASGLQEVGDVVHVYATGGHDAKVRQRGEQRFDIGGAQVVSREELDEVRVGFVRYLRLGGGIGAEHDRAAGGVRDRDKPRPADGRDNELGARGDGGTAGVHIEHGADSDQGTLAQLVARFTDGREGVGGGHGDFDGPDTAGEEGFEQRHHLGGLLGPDDGNDAGIGEQRDDFGFGSHGNGVGTSIQEDTGFPLTPAISPEEREKRGQRWEMSNVIGVGCGRGAVGSRRWGKSEARNPKAEGNPKSEVRSR